MYIDKLAAVGDTHEANNERSTCAGGAFNSDVSKAIRMDEPGHPESEQSEMVSTPPRSSDAASTVSQSSNKFRARYGGDKSNAEDNIPKSMPNYSSACHSSDSELTEIEDDMPLVALNATANKFSHYDDIPTSSDLSSKYSSNRTHLSINTRLRGQLATTQQIRDNSKHHSRLHSSQTTSTHYNSSSSQSIDPNKRLARYTPHGSYVPFSSENSMSTSKSSGHSNNQDSEQPSSAEGQKHVSVESEVFSPDSWKTGWIRVGNRARELLKLESSQANSQEQVTVLTRSGRSVHAPTQAHDVIEYSSTRKNSASSASARSPRSSKQSQSYRCPNGCGQSFKKGADAARHAKCSGCNGNEQKHLLCEPCGKTFTRKDAVMRHMKTGCSGKIKMYQF